MSSLKKYEYVIAIASCGGISQAAEELGIAQPALSKYLKKLEEELGLELFNRSSLPIKTTRAGELFIETGKAMLDAERQLEKQLDEIKKNESSVIRIGISPSRSPYMMPRIIKSYKDKIADGKIIIEECMTTELSEHLANGELDLIITLLDEDTEHFMRVDLFEESLLLALPVAYGNNDISEALKTLPLISVGRGQALWQTMNSIVRKTGIPEPAIEAQSIESAISLVKAGLGATIVPSYIASFGESDKTNNLRFIALSKLGIEESSALYKRKVCLFFRKEQFLTKSEQALIECAENLKNDYK